MTESKTFDESLNYLRKAWVQVKVKFGKMFGFDKVITWVGKFLS
ncbi:hypothetical protein [Enterococcus sp. DIV0691]